MHVMTRSLHLASLKTAKLESNFADVNIATDTFNVAVQKFLLVLPLLHKQLPLISDSAFMERIWESCVMCPLSQFFHSVPFRSVDFLLDSSLRKVYNEEEKHK